MSFHELENFKESPIATHLRLAYRALFFQSPTCTKANFLYISYNQDGDYIAILVWP